MCVCLQGEALNDRRKKISGCASGVSASTVVTVQVARFLIALQHTETDLYNSVQIHDIVYQCKHHCRYCSLHVELLV
jgi:hypothetical protein